MGRLIVLVLGFMKRNWKILIGSLGPILTLAAGWRLKAGREKLKEERRDKGELERQLLLDVEDARDESKDSASKFTSHFSSK